MHRVYGRAAGRASRWESQRQLPNPEVPALSFTGRVGSCSRHGWRGKLSKTLILYLSSGLPSSVDAIGTPPFSLLDLISN